MLKDAVFSMSFQTAADATGIEDIIGMPPYRAYEGRDCTYVLQFDLVSLNRPAQKKIIDLAAAKGQRKPSMLIDIPVYFPDRLASKRIRVPPRLLSFALASGTRIEFSVYKTSR